MSYISLGVWHVLVRCLGVPREVETHHRDGHPEDDDGQRALGGGLKYGRADQCRTEEMNVWAEWVGWQWERGT